MQDKLNELEDEGGEFWKELTRLDARHLRALPAQDEEVEEVVVDPEKGDDVDASDVPLWAVVRDTKGDVVQAGGSKKIVRRSGGGLASTAESESVQEMMPEEKPKKETMEKAGRTMRKNPEKNKTYNNDRFWEH